MTTNRIQNVLFLGYNIGLYPAMVGTGIAWQIAAASGLRSDKATLVAIFLFYWSMYLLDRRAEPLETATEHQPARFVQKRPRAIQFLLLVQVLVQLLLIAQRRWLLVAALATGSISALYFLHLPWFGIRIKDIPYIKSFYVAAVMTVAPFLFFGEWPQANDHTLTACTFGFFLVQASAAFYDLKDIDNDRAAGIRTLATDLGQSRLVLVEQVILALCLVTGCIWSDVVSTTFMVLMVLTFASSWLLRRRTFDRWMCIYFDGMHAMVLLLGSALGL